MLPRTPLVLGADGSAPFLRTMGSDATLEEALAAACASSSSCASEEKAHFLVVHMRVLSVRDDAGE